MKKKKTKNSVQYCLLWGKKNVFSNFYLPIIWILIYWYSKRRRHVILWHVVAEESLQRKLLVSHAQLIWVISTSKSISNSTMQTKDQKRKGRQSHKSLFCAACKEGPAKFPLNVTQLLVHFEVSWNVGFWNVFLNGCLPKILNEVYLFGSEIR